MAKALPALVLLILMVLPAAMAAQPPGPGVQDVNFTLAKTVNRARAQVGDLLQYTIYFNNTGTSTAPTVWINDTPDSHTTYLGDSAATIGGSATSPLHWVFTNVPAGARRSFVVNTSVSYTAVPGTVLINRVTLEYFNTLGKQVLSAAAGTLFGIKTKTLHLHYDGLWDALDPTNTLAPTTNRNCNMVAPCDYDGDGVRGITIRRGANLSDPNQVHEWILSPALALDFRIQGSVFFHLWVDDQGAGGVEQSELYLLDYDGASATTITGPILAVRNLDTFVGFQTWDIGVFVANYTLLAGHYIVVLLAVPSASANNLQFAYDSTAFDSTVTMETPSYIDIPYLWTQNATGAAQGLFDYGEQVTVLAAVTDPFGTFDIVDGFTYVDIYDPTGSLVVTLQPMTLLFAFGSATKIFYFNYNVPNPALQGTYRVRVTTYETNGVTVYNEVTFDVRMPIMTLAKGGPATVRTGATLTYRLFYNNSGTSEARILRIVDTLPGGTTYASDNATVVPTVVNGTATWQFTNVTPGAHFFDLRLTVGSSLVPGTNLRNSAAFNWTDTKYQWLPGTVRQTNTTVLAPTLRLALVPPTTLVRDGQNYVVHAWFNNTGNDVASVAWLNLTFGANGTYVSDDALAQGYNYTEILGMGSVQWRFSNLGVGGHGLNITFRLVSGLPGGAQEPVSGTLAYQNPLGYARPGSSASTLAYLNEPRMVLTLGAPPAFVVPGTTLALALAYDNTGTGVGSATAAKVYLNVSSDWVFRNASAGGSYDAIAHSIAWTLGTVVGGARGWVYANLTLVVQTPDRTTEHLQALAAFKDAVGTPRPRTYSNQTLTSQAPVLALAVTLGGGMVTHGTQLTYTVYYNNTGTGTAGALWINTTLNPALRYVSTTAPGVVTTNGPSNGVSIRIASVGPGGNSFTFVAGVNASFADGLPLNNTFTLDYLDTNGNLRGRLTTMVPATLRSPHVTVELTADRSTAAPRDLVRYTVTIQNTGGAVARDLWVNLTLASPLDYVSDGAPVLPQVVGRAYSWHLVNLAPLATVTFTVLAQVNASAAAGRIAPELVVVESSEAQGPPIAQVRSATVGITIVAPPAQGFLGMDNTVLMLLGLLAAIAAAVGYALVHRRAPIEEVFVVYRDGSLLAHRSKTLTPDKDEDVLAGMFTAVQQFINDSFSYGSTRDLKHMNMGEYSVDIQKGQYLYLAVVHRGKESRALTRRMVQAIQALEAEFQGVLQDWGGNMDQVRGIKDRLRNLLGV